MGNEATANDLRSLPILSGKAVSCVPQVRLTTVQLINRPDIDQAEAFAKNNAHIAAWVRGNKHMNRTALQVQPPVIGSLAAVAAGRILC